MQRPGHGETVAVYKCNQYVLRIGKGLLKDHWKLDKTGSYDNLAFDRIAYFVETVGFVPLGVSHCLKIKITAQH